MKLTVWIAEQNEDSPCYNIIARTKKDALAQIASRPSREFEAPRKIDIYYKDAFELFELTTGESGGRAGFY